MEFRETVEKRHSVRRFLEKEVDQEKIDAILAMAATAPSSKNCKSSSFKVVSDPAVIEAMSQMRDFGSSFVKHADKVIVVMGDRVGTDMWVENCAISATFIQLAATSLGLGSCWVQVRERSRSKTDPSLGMAEDYLRTLVEIPENCSVLCLIALGYEAPKPEAK